MITYNKISNNNVNGPIYLTDVANDFDEINVLRAINKYSLERGDNDR